MSSPASKPTESLPAALIPLSSTLSPAIGERQGNAVWLVSFGDLLTLLLGFFITIIAVTREEKVKTFGTLGSAVVSEGTRSGIGTRIASSAVGLGRTPSSRPSFVLTDEHVADPRSDALRSWAAEWIAQGAREFEFTVCQDQYEAGDVARAIAGLAEKQLPPQVAVRFSELGLGCQALRDRASGLEGASEARVIVQVSLVSNHG